MKAREIFDKMVSQVFRSRLLAEKRVRAHDEETRELFPLRSKNHESKGYLREQQKFVEPFYAVDEHGTRHRVQTEA